MSREKINWKKDTDGVYRKTLRGYDAEIQILASGKAQLTITGSGAPAPATYDTRGQAKTAFQEFLYSK